ncbi:alpha/beta fold hydrolase [Nocardiopsis sp. NPDC050513]|uniref:alpha/beta fold hydrolase n=1 Tax=Nocardiopsis sp. NPDC050513 TaxID=3364338 RepID=UPI0037A96C9A
MHHLRRPQGRIAYDLHGADNDGPLVVCVPGMFDHRASFRFVGSALAEHGFRVAAMDLRGHGDSDAAFDDHTNRAAATDAIALAEELGGTDVIMVGNSLGGAAVTIAARERPDLVAGIALLAPFLRNEGDGALKRLVYRLMLVRPWGPPLLVAFYDRLNVGRTPRGHEEHKRRIRDMLRPRAHYRSVVATVLARSEQILEAGELRARAAVIVGEQDPDWPDPAAEAAWVASVVHGSVEMVPECGHYPQSQRPDVVVPALLRLAEQVSAGA